jgi:DNA polymerase III delta prime subunit
MNNKNLENFLAQAKDSRAAHSVNDRLFALEAMVCSIGASLDEESRANFLKLMNSFSENINPVTNSTVKAIADLNVLSADFKTMLNQATAE